LLLTLKVLRREGFDIIQACNPPDTYFAIAWLYKRLGKHFVYDQHDLAPETTRHVSRSPRVPCCGAFTSWNGSPIAPPTGLS
jgi:hypothetical protein